MTNLQEAIQKGILKLNDDSDRYKENIFRISSLVSCPAKNYYFIKLGLRPKMLGKMLSGILFHEKIKKIVKKIPEFKEAEFEPEVFEDFGDYKILGHIDALTKERVFEFKFSAVDLDKYGAPLSWHFQANCYASITKRPKYSIVLISSHDLSVTIVNGEQNKEGYDILKERAKELFWSLKNNVVPLGPLEDWQCWECECKQVCEHYKLMNKNNFTEG